MRAFSKVLIKLCAGAIALGLVLVIAGFVSGGATALNWNHNMVSSKDLMKLDETYDNVTSIKMDLEYGDVTIKEGDRFRIEGSNLSQKGFSSEVVDGVWTIKDDGTNSENHWSVKLFSLNFGGDGEYTPDITIYLPKDFAAETFELKMGAGRVSADSLVSTKETNIEVGAGEIVIDDLDAANTKMNCGAGKIELNGELTGRSKVECNVGKVELNLAGKEEDYNYQIKCNLGNVSINGEDHEFSASVENNSDRAKQELDLTCNIGEIVVNTN